MKRGALVAAIAAWLTLAGLLALAQAAPEESGPFSNWAAVFVAGDWRAHSGGPSEAFDNARHDLAEAFIAAGFSRQNVREFSTHPERYPDGAPFPSQVQTIANELASLADPAKTGCLVYFTSHGSPEGAVVGAALLTPAVAKRMLDLTCGTRPTVVVMSACFSGVFVPALAGPNRMVLTAARRDRSSFGCGESDRYPYFDACVLESMGKAQDFAALGRSAIACVSRREKEEGLAPASEPQISIGGELRLELPLMPLRSARK
ncbi:MAG TPA: C13 family peptidase [Caulobacteraceae bacterium]|nr:C13 family peptidase [Caulobacteraceae bacterium]